MSRVEEVVRTGLTIGGTVGTTAGSAGTLAPQPITLEGDIHLGDIKVINEESSPAHVQNSETLDGLKQIDYLKAIRDAVDQVEEIENTISVNVADVEKYIAGTPGPSGQGGDNSSSWKGTNELLTDALTSLQALDNASGGSTNVTGEELQVDIVAELPAGTKNIGHVDIDTLIPTANLGQRVSGASLSVTPATDVADETYIGDIKFGESIPQGGNVIGGVTTALDNAAKEAGATIASGDEGLLLAGEDGSSNAAFLQIDSAGNLKVASDTELTTKDYNTGGGTENVAVVGLAVPGASGSVAIDGSNKLPVDTGLTSVSSLGQQAKAASLSVTLASDDDLQTCVNTTNDRLKVEIDAGGFDGTLTGLGEKAQTDSLSVTLATDDDLLNCVDKSNNELNVSIENGGFDGVVTTAANTQLAVTTVQSTFDTGQNSQVGSTARVQVKSASQALQSGITVVASSANTASVFLGDSQVTNSGGAIGFELAAGAGFTFSLSNANLLYAISASGTQTVNFVAM